jgi:hypothetical protein
VKLTSYLKPVLRLRISVALHVHPLDVFMAGRGTTIPWCVICGFHISVLFIYTPEILTSLVNL